MSLNRCGSHTEEQYFNIGRTIELYALALVDCEHLYRFLLIKLKVLVAFADTLLM